MKLSKSFIDLVYVRHSIDVIKLINIRNLIYKLPDIDLVRKSNILIFDIDDNLYAVKIRKCYVKSNGELDIERIHNYINNSDFIKVSNKDYKNKQNQLDKSKITDKILKENTNIIYKFIGKSNKCMGNRTVQQYQ